MYITINDVKGEKTMTYLIQFIQKRKLQLLACISVILRFCYIDL